MMHVTSAEKVQATFLKYTMHKKMERTNVLFMVEAPRRAEYVKVILSWVGMDIVRGRYVSSVPVAKQRRVESN